MKEKKERFHCSVTELKQSPMTIFDLAKQQETGVYVYNRNRAVGVMLSVAQYERLQNGIENNNNESKEQEHMEELIRQTIPFGTVLSARTLDERLCALGFVSRFNPETTFAEMIHELNESGKIEYVGQKLTQGKRILAEVIGEQSNHSNLPDKIIVKKIHTRLQGQNKHLF